MKAINTSRRSGRSQGMTKYIIAVAFATTALGCSVETAPPDADGSTGRGDRESAVAESMPMLYVDQRTEMLLRGFNSPRAGYERQLEACHAAGVATEPLSEFDLGLLGTGRLQRWIGPDRAAVRDESWNYTSGAATAGDHCRFVVTSEGSHYYHDRDGTVWIAFSDNSRHERGAGGHHPVPDRHTGRRRHDDA